MTGMQRNGSYIPQKQKIEKNVSFSRSICFILILLTSLGVIPGRNAFALCGNGSRIQGIYK